MLKKVIAIVLWLSVCSMARGQQDQPRFISDTQGLSFGELSRLAVSRNKDLEAARESLHQAEARLTQARLWPNPTLDISSSTDVMFANEGDSGLSVTVSQPIEFGGKRAKRISVEEASIEVTRAQIADAERQLVTRLRKLFAEAISTASRLELFGRLANVNEQTVNIMDVRLKAGDASRLDSQLLAAQTNQVRTQRLVAENQLARTILQVQALAGYSPGESIILKRELPVEFSEAEEVAVSKALENRPDLKAARLREAMEEAGIVLAKSEAVPNLNLSVGYGRESVATFVTGANRTFERENVMQFGISLPLPLSNREQGNIAQAASRAKQARAEREALEANIRREVALAYRRYEAARRTLEMLRTGVLQPNQESLRIVQLAYSLGDMRLLDVVTQQRVVIEAETAYVDAQTEFNEALADLHATVGDREVF